MTREAVRVRSGPFRHEQVPFDEVVELAGATATLRSGRQQRLPDPELDATRRALAPPKPSGDRAADAAAFRAYTDGPWSPVRAAHALLALADGASDLHLEPGPAGYRCRLRLAGELVDLVDLPTPTGTRLVAALKHLSGCLPYRTDVAQEGRIPREGVTADVRAAFLPTALGERVALRLFGRLLELDALGLDPAVRAWLDVRLAAPSGLLLIAGPSGAGKTTTLYALLAHLARRRGEAHLSLEDPVEQRLRVAGIPVDQVELVPERGLTGEAALVAALRQDVDVLAVGEVRTPAEAMLALKAAHTGRLVLAGVHAGSAREGVQRLVDLGADRTILDTTLLGVLHQRLERRACEPCATCGGLGRRRVVVAEVYGGAG